MLGSLPFSAGGERNGCHAGVLSENVFSAALLRV